MMQKILPRSVEEAEAACNAPPELGTTQCKRRHSGVPRLYKYNYDTYSPTEFSDTLRQTQLL